MLSTLLTDRASTMPCDIDGCQSCMWSTRGTKKVNGSQHGDYPLLKPQQGSKSQQYCCQVQSPENIGNSLCASRLCLWVRTTLECCPFFRICTNLMKLKGQFELIYYQYYEISYFQPPKKGNTLFPILLGKKLISMFFCSCFFSWFVKWV